MLYQGSRWLISSQNPLSPTTNSGASSITMKFSVFSMMFVLHAHYELQTFYPMSFVPKVACLSTPTFCLISCVKSVCSLVLILINYCNFKIPVTFCLKRKFMYCILICLHCFAARTLFQYNSISISLNTLMKASKTFPM